MPCEELHGINRLERGLNNAWIVCGACYRVVHVIGANCDAKFMKNCQYHSDYDGLLFGHCCRLPSEVDCSKEDGTK